MQKLLKNNSRNTGDEMDVLQRPSPPQRQYSLQHYALAERILNGIKKNYRGDVAVIVGINYFKTAEITYLLNDNTHYCEYANRIVPPEEVVAHTVPHVLVVSIVNDECTCSCAVSDGNVITDRKFYNVLREKLS